MRGSHGRSNTLDPPGYAIVPDQDLSASTRDMITSEPSETSTTSTESSSSSSSASSPSSPSTTTSNTTDVAVSPKDFLEPLIRQRYTSPLLRVSNSRPVLDNLGSAECSSSSLFLPVNQVLSTPKLLRRRRGTLPQANWRSYDGIDRRLPDADSFSVSEDGNEDDDLDDEDDTVPVRRCQSEMAPRGPKNVADYLNRGQQASPTEFARHRTHYESRSSSAVAGIEFPYPEDISDPISFDDTLVKHSASGTPPLFHELPEEAFASVLTKKLEKLQSQDGADSLANEDITASIPPVFAQSDALIHPKTPEKTPIKHQKSLPLSYWSYFRHEIMSGRSDVDWKPEWLKAEQIQNFVSIPARLECLIAFGSFLCFDSLLYVFTILPLRILYSLVCIIHRIFSRKQATAWVTPSESADILRGLLIFLCSFVMQFTDASILYHSIRRQSAIKLYVIYNVLEICDRLCASFGQDAMDSLFTGAVGDWKRKGNKSAIWPPLHFAIATICLCLHSLVLAFLVICLNVAVNSYNNALLTLLMSNQFVEIKGSVLKKFEKENLFQLSCSDIVERFQLVIFLVIITTRNLMELASEFTLDYFTTTLGIQILLVFLSECAVDWIKHAFITKFNYIRPSIYHSYLKLLSRDLQNQKAEKTSDPFHLVNRRMGFSVLPVTCLIIRSVAELFLKFDAAVIIAFALLYFSCLIFKIMLGVTLLGISRRIVGTDEDIVVDAKINPHGDGFKMIPPMSGKSVVELDVASLSHLKAAEDQYKIIVPPDQLTLDNIGRYTLFKSRIP